MKDLLRIFICSFVGMAINLNIYWDLISHGPLSTVFNNSFCLWYQRNFLTQNVRHSHSYNQWTDLKLQCWCVGLRAPFRVLRWSWKHIRRHRRRQRWTTGGSTGSKAWCVCNKFTKYFEEFIQRDQSFKIFLQQVVWWFYLATTKSRTRVARTEVTLPNILMTSSHGLDSFMKGLSVISARREKVPNSKHSHIVESCSVTIVLQNCPSQAPFWPTPGFHITHFLWNRKEIFRLSKIPRSF